jgi:integrase
LLFWPDVFLKKVIRPAPLRAGTWKTVGWHTFRHSFSTMLIANEENVKVVQELMRHASGRCTLDVYSQARIRAKREAQERVVKMIPPADTEVPEPAINGNDSNLGSR